MLMIIDIKNVAILLPIDIILDVINPRLLIIYFWTVSTTVSYTHLDVYKRQVFGSLPVSKGKIAILFAIVFILVFLVVLIGGMFIWLI